MTEGGALPRLVINYAAPDLDGFRAVAAAAAQELSDRFAVRMVVSHLARKDTAQRTDPGDPYLEYSANFPDVFHFVLPPVLEPHRDARLVDDTLRLAQRKLEVVRDLGIKAAFLGREPAYLPEAVYGQFPEWRGPRVDHPRRSRNPIFAPCFHQPEIQAMYRDGVEALIERLPEIDTFYWWTNDSAAGFCWYPYLYPGPNGPEACREQGPIPAMAAFHSAVLDGSRARGVQDPMSIMTQVRIWDDQRMPAGSHRYPAPDASRWGIGSIAADVSYTYPVGHLWDALGRLDQVRAVQDAEPPAVIWWLSDVYHRASIDPSSARRQVRLWAAANRQPERLAHTVERIGLVRDLAEAEFGPAAAGDAVDAWAHLQRAFDRQVRGPFALPLPWVPAYGAVTHRWLTRPLVAFPSALTAGEEAHFLPHVFAVGDEERRSNLLDVHGYPAADARAPYDLRSRHYNEMVAAFEAAAGAFERAASKASGSAERDLATAARAARLMASIWTTVRNWIEFGVLRAQGRERAADDPTRLSPHDREDAETYRRRLFAILRSEYDNTLAFQRQLGADPEGVVTRAATPAEEDTFTLGPDLQAQVTRKRQIMLAHWQDMARLVPAAEA